MTEEASTAYEFLLRWEHIQDGSILSQAAFRGLAMQWHPDKVDEKDKAAASRRFQRLNEAYSILRDPVKRRQYDGR